MRELCTLKRKIWISLIKIQVSLVHVHVLCVVLWRFCHSSCYAKVSLFFRWLLMTAQSTHKLPCMREPNDNSVVFFICSGAMSWLQHQMEFWIMKRQSDKMWVVRFWGTSIEYLSDTFSRWHRRSFVFLAFCFVQECMSLSSSETIHHKTQNFSCYTF